MQLELKRSMIVVYCRYYDDVLLLYKRIMNIIEAISSANYTYSLLFFSSSILLFLLCWYDDDDDDDDDDH